MMRTMAYNPGKCLFLLDFAKPACRLWGILTAIGLWGIGVEVTYHGHALGIYVIVVAVLLTFLETTWVVTIFAAVCIRDESHIFTRCWDYVLWFDLWKKSLFYLVCAAVMFINLNRLLLIIGGTLLIILAILYGLQTLAVRRMRSQDPLLRYQDHPYDRFEDSHDDIDDTLPEAVHPESVVDQEEILTI